MKVFFAGCTAPAGIGMRARTLNLRMRTPIYRADAGVWPIRIGANYLFHQHAAVITPSKEEQA